MCLDLLIHPRSSPIGSGTKGHWSLGAPTFVGGGGQVILNPLCQLCSMCAGVLCDVVLNNYSYDVESLKYKIDTFFRVGEGVKGKGPFSLWFEKKNAFELF